MDFDFTAAQQAFRNEVRAWLGANVPADLKGRGFASSRGDRGTVERLKRWQADLHRAGYVGIATGYDDSTAGLFGRLNAALASASFAPDVVGAQHRCRTTVEILLQLHQDRPGPAAAPGRRVAEGVQFLRGVAQASGSVGDLRVGGEHDAVGTPECKHYGHQHLLLLIRSCFPFE